MKININIDSCYNETEITINSAHMSDELERVIASLRILDLKLTGTKDNQTYILNTAKILYIDTTDKKTFLYTKEHVYESSLRLYELEQKLSANDFFRAGNQVLSILTK